MWNFSTTYRTTCTYRELFLEKRQQTNYIELHSPANDNFPEQKRVTDMRKTKPHIAGFRDPSLPTVDILSNFASDDNTVTSAEGE